MSMRLRTPAPVVIDGRGLASMRLAAWIPEGPIPSVFEFARACGLAAWLVAADGRRHAIRIVAILYLGGRIFAEPGRGASRFGVLLRARGRVAPGRHGLFVAGAGFAPLHDVPIHAIPAARVRALGGNLFFVVG